MSALDNAIGNSMSFPGLKPPNNAYEIGQVVHGREVFIYYRGNDGEFYYDTASGQAFKRKMAEAEKRRRQERMDGTKK